MKSPNSVQNAALQAQRPDKREQRETNEPTASVEGDSQKIFYKRIFKVAKLLIFILVLFWIVRCFYKNWGEIVQFDWNPRFRWLFLSGVFYILAYLPSASFWYLSLRWLGQDPEYWSSLKAFYISQLGKYVPGKAMVVLIRSEMISGPNVRPSIAVVSVFYETLTMMGSGAFIASIIVVCYFRQHLLYSALAFGVAIFSLFPLLPPVFIRLLKFLRVGKDDPQIQESLQRLHFSRLFQGLAMTSILWLFFGLFLWAAIRGLGITPSPLFSSLPLYIAVVALAMTLGFAVPVSPGGIGIRETVLAALLIPYLEVILNDPSNQACSIAPDSLAMIISVIQRLISIIAELAIAFLILIVPYLLRLFKKMF